MVDAVNSGYHSNAVDTGVNMNSDTNGTYTALGSAIDNSVGKHLQADFELNLASVLPTAGGTIDLYLVPALPSNQTAYPDWTEATASVPENEQYYAGSFTLKANTETQEVVLRNVVLPPGAFKVATCNQSGATLAASANTLYYRPHGFASQ